MTGIKVVTTNFADLVPTVRSWLAKQISSGIEPIESRVKSILTAIAFAYLIASVTSDVICHVMVRQILAIKSLANYREETSHAQAFERPTTVNGRDIIKAVKERNIFNSDGKFPEEKIGGDGDRALARFDINAPCSPTALPIELLGTIYLGDRFRSIATVKDKNYSEADVYRVGDHVYGVDEAIVAAVERNKIIINNAGTKECIELEKDSSAIANDGFPSNNGVDFGGMPKSGGGAGSEITLEAAYVESELGPGFGKIVDAARLVPNTIDGGINGFKIFSIKGGTLFARVGLQNGDVVTQVNETSMSKPEQGFALYQAFQDEKEVRIQLLRGGQTPQNITVRIK